MTAICVVPLTSTPGVKATLLMVLVCSICLLHVYGVCTAVCCATVLFSYFCCFLLRGLNRTELNSSSSLMLFNVCMLSVLCTYAGFQLGPIYENNQVVPSQWYESSGTEGMELLVR